jgi:DNA topoisomerase-1
MADKWQTLHHHGPLFAPEYEYKRLPVYVAEQEYILSPEAEERIYHWAQKHNTDYVKDKTFQKNFWKDVKPLLPVDIQNSKFPDDWNFSRFINDIEQRREAKKARSKEEKKAEKEEKERIKEIYGYAELDGQRVQLGNYMVEPPGLFMGRGKHPLRGRWKPRTYPEDITINLSSDATPPTPQYPGGGEHEWGEIVENKNALWTARWYCKLTGNQKRVLFGATSSVKQEADRKKFEKAISLANNFESIIAYIDSHLASKSKHVRQTATVAKIISELAIRVGDEKGEDEAETFGATTLLCKHITLYPQTSEVVFDFLGKDSVRYYNKTQFPQQVIANIEEAMQGKDKDDRIFPSVRSSDVNEFLQNKLDGLTAKQFRTAIGSEMLAKELKKQEIANDISAAKKLEYYTEANLEIAKKLNHQKAVSESYDTSLSNMKERLKDLKKQLKEKKKLQKEEIAEAKEKKDQRVAFAKERRTGQKQRDAIKRANDTYRKKKEVWEKRIEKMNERIEKMESRITIKEKTRGMALNTSKTNYADPRIPVSWCKDYDVDIKRIFPKTMQEKFTWAMEVSPDFYKKYPNVEGEEE